MVKINKPNLAFRGSLTPINKARVDKLVQHHMAHESWGITDVHNYHKNGNGWAGIGYNFWIDFKGNVYQGRGFNVGAHVGGHNSHTIGIGYQGDFTTQKMPDAQLKAGIELNKWLINQLPNVSKNDIVGHRDLASTACPGKNFRMDELIKGVGGKTSKPPASKPAKPNTGDYKGNSIVDYLKHHKQDSSFSNRSKLAKKHSISNYKGTPSQNTKLLNALRGKKSKPKTKNKYPLPNGVLKVGSRGNGVKQLQCALNAANFKVGAVDGIYGAKTKDGVTRFQSVHDAYNVDGVYGPRTKTRLDKVVN